MGSVLSKPKKPDTSKQEAALKAQQLAAEQQEAQAQLESDRLRDTRISAQKSMRGRLAGRQSLIKTSELGVTEDLG